MAQAATLDRSHAVPLYHQIFLILRDEILSGGLAFGAALPTEAKLAECYAVSRITARRALAELAQHGLVERRQRTGTRVVHRQAAQPIDANIDQAVESLIAFGRETEVRVLALADAPADAAVAQCLRIGTGDPVLRAVRLRLRAGEPLGEVVSHVPAAIGVRIERRDLTAMPMLALLREAGHMIGGGTQTISAGLADSQLAALLGVEVRAPILRIERMVVDQTGRPLLFTVARYRADRYRIGIDLHMPGRPVATTE